MKRLAPVAVAFGMFSRIPVPAVDWNERNLRYALSAFPLVGLVQGTLVFGWWALAGWLHIPPLLVALGYTLLPIAMNGGIHLDGLCDTADALASHAPQVKKLEILKDPHIGAFGVLALVCHLLTAFVLFTCLDATGRIVALLGCSYMLSRALSGIAVLQWPGAKAEGMADSFRKNGTGGKSALLLWVQAAAMIGVLLAVGGLLGAGMVAAALLAWLYYRHMAMKQFGGVTGDLAGWFLQTAELCMLAVLVAGGLMI